MWLSFAETIVTIKCDLIKTAEKVLLIVFETVEFPLSAYKKCNSDKTTFQLMNAAIYSGNVIIPSSLYPKFPSTNLYP